MFLEENDSALQQVTSEGRDAHAIYMLMQSYIEYECKLSRAFVKQQDLDQEVQNRLAKIFS